METKRDVERFIDQIKYGRVSRREIMRMMAAAGLAVALMPQGRLAHADDGQPTIFTWTGYDVPDMWKEYTAKYNANPNSSIWGDEEEAESKIRAGFHPDMVMPCSYKVVKWNDSGFLKPIDVTRLAHWGEIIPTLYNVPDTVIDGKRMWIPMWWGLTAPTFRTDLAPEYVPAEMHSWGILWDEKYTGKLSMIDSLIDGVMAAAIYSGAKDPFNMTDDEVAKCKELMVKQRPLLRFYTNDNTGWQQALASGELIAADFLERHHPQPAETGHPLDVHDPEGRPDDLDLRHRHDHLGEAGDGGPRLRPHQLNPAVAVRSPHHRDVGTDTVEPDGAGPPKAPRPCVSPSRSIPSSAKNALAASRSSTTMRTLSIR